MNNLKAKTSILMLFFTGSFIILLQDCSLPDKKNNKTSETDPTSLFQEEPAIVEGKILNLEVYPNIKEIKLTIPGFEGDKVVFTTEINESGEFRFEFYPKAKREISLSPIEDILVIQPGDSLFVLKDFTDIGKSDFSGNNANLNLQISKFRAKYLGRYPTDYQQSYFDFKSHCENEKNNNYQKLIDFQQENTCSDDFISWANKQIELDFCKALFNYPRQHFARIKQELTDSAAYFSFIENFEGNIDNSIIMTDYFVVTEQFLSFQLFNLLKEHKQKVELIDTTGWIGEEIFSATENNYLAQFSFCTFLNISLNANKTDWIEKYSKQTEKIKDPFLKNNFQEHYDRVNEFNKNPKRFSDLILSTGKEIQQTGGISIESVNDNNIVKELINANAGKVIYIDFWATWCPPCIHYMQYSKLLISDFKGKDVEFVFICINSKEEFWKEKVRNLSIGGNHIYCNDVETRAIRNRFGFSGIPYYLLIDKKGVIVDFGLHLNPERPYVKTAIGKLLNE